MSKRANSSKRSKSIQIPPGMAFVAICFIATIFAIPFVSESYLGFMWFALIILLGIVYGGKEIKPEAFTARGFWITALFITFIATLNTYEGNPISVYLIEKGVCQSDEVLQIEGRNFHYGATSGKSFAYACAPKNGEGRSIWLGFLAMNAVSYLLACVAAFGIYLLRKQWKKMRHKES